MNSRASLERDLAALGITSSDTLLVHSSMKKIGPTEGGAETVLDALCSFPGKGGLLVLPTLTYSLNAENPVFSVMETPSIVGLLTEMFRHRPGVVRSWHPTHSVAAFGEGAAAFTAGHERFDTPCARQSPWGRLIDRRAKILFLGTGIGCNTFLHGVEEHFGVPGMLTENHEALRVIAPDGTVIPVPSRRHVGNHSRFYAKMEPVFDRAGILTRGRFGEADCILLEAAPMSELVTKLLHQDPFLFTHDRLPEQVFS